MEKDERTAEIAKMWDAGLGLTEIADEVGTSTALVRRALAGSGRSTKKVVNKTYEHEVIQEYQHGATLSSISMKHNISNTKLYTILARNKVPIRSVVQRTGRNRQMEEAVQMYKDGYLLKQIFTDCGVSQPALHLELHKLDIPLRRPRKRREAK